jgi:hypothetical protein
MCKICKQCTLYSAYSVCPDQREDVALLEHQAMPSLRNVAHDGQLCTFSIKQELEIPSARSWQLVSGQPVRY